ncbi:MAG: ROK family protein, partial [Saprospiraceae bacterium]|nr:ROK family protein [Saprospiraceae bacterium]
MVPTKALGIDIGGTSTKLGLVNKTGELLRFTSFPSRAQEDFKFFLEDLKSVTEDFLNEDKVIGVGIGAPDASPLDGTMSRPANFKWGEKVHLVDGISKVLNQKAFLTNDANAAALGEWYFGAAKGMTDFVVITLGTGVGSGFISNGRLLWGKRGMAGEFGHIVTKPNGRDCSCGHRGCLEMYASARGIRQTVLEFLAESEAPSSLRGYDLKNMSVRKIEKAA